MLKFKNLKFYIFLMVLLAAASGPSAAAAQPNQLERGLPLLGTAENFAVLGGSTVTNTGTSVVTGNLGVWPGTEVTGYPPGIVNGTMNQGNAVAQQAQTDLTIAYNDLAGRACNNDLSGTDLGGLTLTEAVYCFTTSALLTGPLVLDAEGNADAVFVFQIGSTLTTASNSSVEVINQGTECNIYWLIGTSATLGTATTLGGNILALSSITLNTSANVSGRILARNGAVTTDTNNISIVNCLQSPTDVSLTNFGSGNSGLNIGFWLLLPLGLLGIAFWVWQKRQTAV